MNLIGIVIALLLFSSSIVLIYKVKKQTLIPSRPDGLVLLLSCSAELLYVYLLGSYAQINQGFEFSFFSVFALISAIVVFLYISASFTKPVEILGIIILPISAISALLFDASPMPIERTSQLANGLQIHILLSVLAYSLMAIAACQAILFYIQNHLLKTRQTSGFVHSLPALESMENLLYQIIYLGFVLLSLGLFSGAVFLENMFAQHLAHKTVLSIIAWVIYGLLIWGRFKYGWRGNKGVKLTISAFIFLMLAFFGSKFVSELIIAA